MEKVVPTALSERQKEHEDGGEKPTLTTLASKKEDLSTLEHPQAEESVSAFLKDANPSLENVALSGMSKEGWNVLKEAVPGSSEKVEAMDREGKANDGMHSRKAGPCFLSPFTHQEADDALEACDVADALDGTTKLILLYFSAGLYVFLKTGHYNALCMGMPLKAIWRLQQVQNAAARLVSET